MAGKTTTLRVYIALLLANVCLSCSPPAIELEPAPVCTRQPLSALPWETIRQGAVIQGDVLIERPSQIADHINTTRITGELRIQTQALHTLAGFPKLITVDKLTIINNTHLTEISGFENLMVVEDQLTIYKNPKLVTVPRFDSLQRVAGLIIRNNPVLHRLRGFDSFRQADTFNISGNKTLQTIYGFHKFYQVHTLIIADNIGLTKIPDFQSIDTIGGTFVFAGNQSFKFMEGCDCIKTIGSIRITNNTLLRSIRGFLDVRHIKGYPVRNQQGESTEGMTINFNTELRLIKGFEKIESIQGSLNFTHNYAFLILPRSLVL